LTTLEIPLRRAMNALLLDSYHADCSRIVDRWNRTLLKYGIDRKITLPSLRFNRQIGIHAGKTYDPQGNPVSKEESERRQGAWFSTDEERAYVQSCMVKVD